MKDDNRAASYLELFKCNLKQCESVLCKLLACVSAVCFVIDGSGSFGTDLSQKRLH